MHVRRAAINSITLNVAEARQFAFRDALVRAPRGPMRGPSKRSSNPNKRFLIPISARHT